MKPISSWAFQHKTTAILLVVAIKIILLLLAVKAGLFLFQQGIVIPGYTSWLVVLGLLLLTILYYSRKWNYAKRKAMETCFIYLTFVGISSFVNNLDSYPGHTNRSVAASHIKKDKKQTAAQILESLQYRDKSTLTKKEKRILKKEFKSQLKKFVAYSITGQQEKAADSWKIVLVIIAAVGLLALLGALVCNLSCNGADAAAVIVGLLGLTAIIWGSIALIRHIKRKSAKPAN